MNRSNPQNHWGVRKYDLVVSTKHGWGYSPSEWGSSTYPTRANAISFKLEYDKALSQNQILVVYLRGQMPKFLKKWDLGNDD